MMPGNVKAGNVKANPKMHKKDVPIRTIVSGINNPTEKMAEVVESELQSWVSTLPTYIKDTTHFLRLLEDLKKHVPPGAIMFSMDVKALYPSVPRLESIAACREAFNARSDNSISTEALMEMLNLVLENNIFDFNQHQ